MTTIVIQRDGFSYFLKILPGEYLYEANQRLLKIMSHQPQTEYQWEQLIHLSELWFYHQRTQCRYSDNLESLIKLFDMGGHRSPR